jgi:uncharacterized protein (DUF4415 family)
MNEAEKRKGRGKGKKPALGMISLRIDKDVLDFYKTHYKSNVQKKLREVLTEYVATLKEKQSENI